MNPIRYLRARCPNGPGGAGLAACGGSGGSDSAGPPVSRPIDTSQPGTATRGPAEFAELGFSDADHAPITTRDGQYVVRAPIAPNR